MSDLICAIDCSWDAVGKVAASITSGSFGDVMTDNLQLLSPSVPMLVSHQLGTFLPASDLALTSCFIDYIVSRQDMMSPINSTLKGAKLEFFRRSQGGVAIQFIDIQVN